MEDSRELFIKLAELAHANVSGPIKREMIARAQRQLVKKLRENGDLSPEEAEDLRS